MARKISWNQKEDTNKIFLFNDETAPWLSETNLISYSERFATLASYKTTVCLPKQMEVVLCNN